MSIENRYLLEILALSEQMLNVAHKGVEQQVDMESGIVFSTLHDYARHLKKLAAEQVDRHKRLGFFDEDDAKRMSSFQSGL
jgi:hypothetical protein